MVSLRLDFGEANCGGDAGAFCDLLECDTPAARAVPAAALGRAATALSSGYSPAVQPAANADPIRDGGWFPSTRNPRTGPWLRAPDLTRQDDLPKYTALYSPDLLQCLRGN